MVLLKSPKGLALDSQHLYWTTNNASQAPSSRSSNLDGTEEKFTFLGSNTIALRGIAVDSTHVYWVSQGENKIGRANLDLTGVEPGFITGIEKSMGLATDGDHLYWSANGDLLPNAGNDLYRFEADAPVGHRLTDSLKRPTKTASRSRGSSAPPQQLLCYYAANSIPEGGVRTVPTQTAKLPEPEPAKAPTTKPAAFATSTSGTTAALRVGTTTFIARLDAGDKMKTDSVDSIPSRPPVRYRFAKDGPRLLRRPHPALSLPAQPHLLPDRRDKSALPLHLGDGDLLRLLQPDWRRTSRKATLTSIGPPRTLALHPPPSSPATSPPTARGFFQTNEALVAADTNADEGCPPGARNQTGIRAARTPMSGRQRATAPVTQKPERRLPLPALDRQEHRSLLFPRRLSQRRRRPLPHQLKLVRQDEDSLPTSMTPGGRRARHRTRRRDPLRRRSLQGHTCRSPEPLCRHQQFSGPGNPKSVHKKAKKKQKKHKRHASKRHHKNQHKRQVNKTRRAGR